MKRQTILGVLGWLILAGLTASTLMAHPGRTDSSGCHTCKTNCPKWGLEYGEYHCHHSGRSRVRKPPVQNGPRKPEGSRRPTRPPFQVGGPDDVPKTLGGQLVAIDVIDGDTFLARRDGRLQRFHLHDADAPELTQDFGLDAKRLLERLILETDLRVMAVQVLTRNQQSVRVQLPDGRMLGRELIARGAAWCRNPQDPEAIDLCLEQELARQNRRGLWRSAAPVRPSDWLRGVREPG